ncbi:MAG: uncharacterized protein KVP18_000006 [Porospora cf. gigantea A]|uniref:uncharacterized protein n=1 Tax=Porospora cf. gigantea A TaxID=2853593 RepID=UPI00355A2930|nr:MAG: hypothetical protein KVP18_000006 [Porospora cf. gigantea A]
MISGIHHAAIIASDIGRSRHFYVEVLGFRIIAENYRSNRDSWKIDLDTGSGQIELFTFPGAPPRPSYPEAQGLRHLAFTVSDLDKAVERLQSFGVGVEPVRVDEYTGTRFTFFQDPDDLPLELYESL